jgi:hypothetical protein
VEDGNMEPMTGFEFLLPVALGIGLAAASGLRVFAPLLVLGLAAHWGYVPVGDSFAWVATTPALIMLGIAATLEVLAYYVPGLDNLLDSLATPAAVIAGIAVSAAVMTNLPPMLKWVLAIIAGGGAAAITQSATALVRGSSTVVTAGLGNPVIATGELVGALGLSLLAIAAPLIALGAAILFCLAAYRLTRALLRRKSPGAGG